VVSCSRYLPIRPGRGAEEWPVVELAHWPAILGQRADALASGGGGIDGLPNTSLSNDKHGNRNPAPGLLTPTPAPAQRFGFRPWPAVAPVSSACQLRRPGR